ncbi:MAG TPA: hypothetical protein VL793_03120, partial [Patescibacteria group bacterium]|nr:hypothetical protein [Patescibacteria group bacterium]
MNSKPVLQAKGLRRFDSSGFSTLALVAGLLIFGYGQAVTRAAIQFDVFVGFDGIVPEASWFPLVCEIKNDGPPFTATIDVKRANEEGQGSLTTIELPT